MTYVYFVSLTGDDSGDIISLSAAWIIIHADMFSRYNEERSPAMIIKHRGMIPSIDPSAYVAPNATIAGDVTIGPKARIMFGTVINAEGSKIMIGGMTIISENAVIRATAEGNEDHPAVIGDNVFVGPHATILGAMVEQCSYIATGATLLQGARVSSGSVITVGALVHVNTVIKKDSFVPPYTTAVGDPVQFFSPDEKKDMEDAIKAIGFARTAFDIDMTGKTRAEIHKEATATRSKEYGAHFDDEIV
jgi:carbonic anhydrase/acetyltransferase-like protein (isoleucine patch superfamily)